MTARTAGRKGRPYQRARAFVLANDNTCWWCGHPGANAVDHIIPRSLGGANSIENYRPIHGVEGCPVCPTRMGKRRVCNSEKGNSLNPPPVQGSRPW